MEAFADFLDSRLLDIESANGSEKCQRDGTITPIYQRPSLLGPQVVTGFELITVGTQGRVQRITGRGPLFGDGFETGDTSSWSASIPN